ncbi:39S ribosomal protein L42, mitochondrial isoform X2 [Rhincodon typus]|uniref:39S ribosomal protein L42, mitochondrial isoform X2 n=1 Tax=Rhincodon typus TaxID=259920 RepID=UPI00202E0932|nr:39S ribosomal protein L42, mitochondrial isoform X2 [Rhincodon typus]
MAAAAGRRRVMAAVGRLLSRGEGPTPIAFEFSLKQLSSLDSKVDLAITSDGRTIVCYHPSVDIPYEHTKPITRPSPAENKEETHDQVLKARLDKEVLRDKQAPTIEELSKMFYTTKHRWYPIGQYHKRRIKPNPPKDR